jgi:hypothetical protein
MQMSCCIYSVSSVPSLLIAHTAVRSLSEVVKQNTDIVTEPQKRRDIGAWPQSQFVNATQVYDDYQFLIH